VPTLGGQTVMRPFVASGPTDQTRIESRNDVCVFTSEPLSDRNLNTGDQRAPRYETARQRIYHDSEHPSYVELPVRM
jgi:predicted acyl esterase